MGSIAVTLNKNRPSTGAGVNRFTEAKDNRFMRFAHLSCYHKVTRNSWEKKKNSSSKVSWHCSYSLELDLEEKC